MSLVLVPWEPTWLDHGTLDLHAIYRRPARDPQTWEVLRDEDGFVIWNLVGPMTIRNHNRYRMKGLEYVTLGRAEDVLAAASPSIAERGARPLGADGRPVGEHPDDYNRQKGIRGPWDATVYLADMEAEKAARRARIIDNIAAYGPDGAEAFEKQTDPGYTLPAKYRQAAEAQEPPKRKRGRPRKVEAPVEPETAPVSV